ncbi:MAG: hypothetical protein QOG62_1253 [Thermoleophilaceae bacterium]|jgi:signal transduction histidine kinase|nr:hypothetical protein [Thermoleophilaceae bacterium]
MHTTSSSEAASSSPQLAALEVIADVLARAEDTAAPDSFYSGLAEAVCRLGSMQRAIVFGYDDVLREVRAVGSHNIDADLFEGVQVGLETAPVAAQALDEDRVIEITADLTAALAEEYAPLVGESTLICTPMAAAGRQVGVILSDRSADSPPLTPGESNLLWVFGKMAALAAISGTAARQSERARLLEHRLDLARDLHERVVQRLFGASLVLASDEPMGREERDRCANELTEAATDLRRLVQRSDSETFRRPQRPLAAEIERLQREHPGLGIVAGGELGSSPDGLEGLVQSVLAEAVRNAHKHANPTQVEVRARSEGDAFILEVENDGVRPSDPAAIAGMGLRLAAFDALEHGGIVEFGARPGDRWQVRLLLPEKTR